MSQFDEMSRLNVVLNRATALAQEDDNFRQHFFDHLNILFDNLFEDDILGTEGQNDPRGDQRDGEFTMTNIQGYDE
jgi:hypothetical protein